MASPLRPVQQSPRATPADPLDIPRSPLTIRTLRRRGSIRVRQDGPVVDPVDRVRGEFIEMRGFSPTPEQAARLFDLSPEECDRVLRRLVAEGFLKRSPDGRYRSQRN